MDHGHEAMSQGEKTVYAIVVVGLVLGAGLMSGLTLGLLSLDVMDLEVLRVAGSIKERAAATRLIKLVSKPHWLLCTLLLCNAGCMEALPLFLDRLLDPIGAILLSVTAILVFGEIIPQAVCSRYGVAIGAAMAPVVRGLMLLCAPITWPLGKLLDIVLGHREGVMKRRELKAMVSLHGEGAGFGGALSPQEVAVIHGAMDLTSKTALTAMTPIEKVFMLSDATLLDESTISRILQSGHSRVPVYRGENPQDITGLVLVKELLQFWRVADPPCVSQLDVRAMPHIPADTPMFDVLRLFQTGNSHMALLMAPEGTDIENLRKTRGRLSSKDTETGCSMNDVLPYADSTELDSVPFVHRKRSSEAQLGKEVHQEDLKGGGASGNKKKEKRVRWKGSGSSSSSAGGNSKKNSKEANKQQGSDYVALEIVQPASATCAANAAASQSDAQSAGQTAAVIGSRSSSSSSSSACIWAPLSLLPEKLQQRLVPVGILTLEDIIEELLQAEIIDETDRYMDNEQTQAVDLHNLIDSLPPHLHTMLRAEMLAAAENFLQSAKAVAHGSAVIPGSAAATAAAAAVVMRRASSCGTASAFDALVNDAAYNQHKVTLLGKLGNEAAAGRGARSSDPGSMAAAVAAAAAAAAAAGAARKAAGATAAPVAAAAAAVAPAETIRAPSSAKSFKSVSVKSASASKGSDAAAAAAATAAAAAVSQDTSSAVV